MKYGMPAKASRRLTAGCPLLGLEEARAPLGYRKTEMLVGPLGQHPAPRRALHQALLEQVGLEDVLDRVRLLPDRHREGRQAHGPTAELARHDIEQPPVVPVEPGSVDLEHLEGVGRESA